jgi:hypothetical protein
MREHKLWQHRAAEEMTREILAELEEAAECQAGRGPARIVRGA